MSSRPPTSAPRSQARTGTRRRAALSGGRGASVPYGLVTTPSSRIASSAGRTLPGWTLQHRRVRLGEAERAIEVVRVLRVQHPPKTGAGPLVDQRADECTRDAAPAVRGHNEDVG